AELPGEACVRLDATPAGEPLYRRFGFVPEYPLVRIKITVDAKQFRGAPGRAPAMKPNDFASAFALHRHVFGADPGPLLSPSYLPAPELAWIVEEGSVVTGSCFGRPGSHYRQLGPIVGDGDTARELITHCFSQHDGASFAVDVSRMTLDRCPWLDAGGFEIE